MPEAPAQPPRAPRRVSRREFLQTFTGANGSNAADYTQITYDAPKLTPTESFFHVLDPGQPVRQVDIAYWTLLVDGLVERPLVLTYDQLRAMPAVEAVRAVAGPASAAGEPLLGNALWGGIPFDALLDEVIAWPEVTFVYLHAVGGAKAVLPAELITGQDALLALDMNAEPLRPEHGYPLRLLVPGLVDAPAFRWVKHIRLLHYNPNGATLPAAVPVQARLTSPPPGAALRIGEPVALQGVAFAGKQPITGVELSVDDGGWMPATLAAIPWPHAWTQWYATWTPQVPGAVRVRVRATTADARQMPENYQQTTLTVT